MGRPPIIRREKLLQTARALFTRKGLKATTLADIASQLRVSPAAILRHTRSKEALFVEAMAPAHIELPLCFDRLRNADGTEDPRILLRGFAREMVPFIRDRIRHLLAIYMHLGAAPDVFTPPRAFRSTSGGPARAVVALESYFRRAAAAGTVRLRNPRAGALLFLGALQSYVLMHYVLKVAPRPFPIDQYLDTLFDVWCEGALKPRSGGRHGKS